MLQEGSGRRAHNTNTENARQSSEEVSRVACGGSKRLVPFGNLTPERLPFDLPLAALQQGALEAAHQCMAFVEDVAGVSEKLTTNALYTVVYRELLSTAQPQRTPKRPAAVLEVLEELVLEESATFHFRVYVVGAPAVLRDTQVCRPLKTQPKEGL